MKRRDFLKLGIVAMPALAGCMGPAMYDRSKYGDIKSVGIIKFPFRIGVWAASSSNMYSAGGENQAKIERAQKALGPLLVDLDAEMRKALAADLAASGIASREIAYRESSLPINPSFLPVDYSGEGEPLYLECQLMATFVRLQDGIAPGLGSYTRLATDDGQLVWQKEVSIGLVPSYSQGTVVAMPKVRWPAFNDALDKPEETAKVFLAMAPMLGRVIAASLVQESKREGSVPTRQVGW